MKNSKRMLPALRTLVVLCFYSLLAPRVWPQISPAKPVSTFSPDLLSQLREVRDAALASDYAWQQLAHLTENIGPRPSGSPAAQAAAEYVAAELKKLGLEVHLEPRAGLPLGARRRKSRTHRISRPTAEHAAPPCAHRAKWQRCNPSGWSHRGSHRRAQF